MLDRGLAVPAAVRTVAEARAYVLQNKAFLRALTELAHHGGGRRDRWA